LIIAGVLKGICLHYVLGVDIRKIRDEGDNVNIITFTHPAFLTGLFCIIPRLLYFFVLEFDYYVDCMQKLSNQKQKKQKFCCFFLFCMCGIL